MNFNLTEFNFSDINTCTQIVYEQPSIYIPLVLLIIGTVTSTWVLYDLYQHFYKHKPLKKKSLLWASFITFLVLQYLFFIINYYFM